MNIKQIAVILALLAALSACAGKGGLNVTDNLKSEVVQDNKPESNTVFYLNKVTSQTVYSDFFTWSLGAINAGDTVIFEVSGIAGMKYDIYWDDSYQGSGSLPNPRADIKVSAYKKDLVNFYFRNVDSGYNTASTFTPTVTEKFYLVVQGYTTSSAGYFALKADSYLSSLNIPAGVSASDSSYTDRVTVSWSSAAGAPGYHVYRAYSANGSYVRINNEVITGLSFDDYDSGYTACYYKVAAVDATGRNGKLSASDSGKRNAVIPAPADISASQGTHYNYVFLSWKPVNDSQIYKVYRNTVNDPAAAVLLTNADENENGYETYFYDKTTVQGTVYYYWVTTVSWDNIESSKSSAVTGFSSATVGDRYEHDDSNLEAREVVPGFIAFEFHSLNTDTDEDWVKFYGKSGEKYKFLVSYYLAGITAVDTVSLLYAAGDYTTNLLTVPGGMSAVDWICPADGWYYLKTSAAGTDNKKGDYALMIALP